MVLLVACGSAVPGPGRDILDEVLAHPATRRYAVEPLSAEGTAGWLRASFFPDADDRFCSALHEASGGNPWLIGELCRELARRCGTPTAAAVARDRSRGPRVGRRDRDAPGTRDRARGAAALLEAAAVLGPDAELAPRGGLDRASSAAAWPRSPTHSRRSAARRRRAADLRAAGGSRRRCTVAPGRPSEPRRTSGRRAPSATTTPPPGRWPTTSSGRPRAAARG